MASESTMAGALPLEILEEIIRCVGLPYHMEFHVDVRTGETIRRTENRGNSSLLKNLSLTSSAFRAFAQKILFSIIVFDGQDLSREPQRMRGLLNLMHDKRETRIWTKTLTCDPSSSSNESHELAAKLVVTMQGVKCISFVGFSLTQSVDNHFLHYLCLLKCYASRYLQSGVGLKALKLSRLLVDNGIVTTLITGDAPSLQSLALLNLSPATQRNITQRITGTFLNTMKEMVFYDPFGGMAHRTLLQAMMRACPLLETLSIPPSSDMDSDMVQTSFESLVLMLRVLNGPWKLAVVLLPTRAIEHVSTALKVSMITPAFAASIPQECAAITSLSVVLGNSGIFPKEDERPWPVTLETLRAISGAFPRLTTLSLRWRTPFTAWAWIVEEVGEMVTVLPALEEIRLQNLDPLILLVDYNTRRKALEKMSRARSKLRILSWGSGLHWVREGETWHQRSSV